MRFQQHVRLSSDFGGSVCETWTPQWPSQTTDLVAASRSTLAPRDFASTKTKKQQGQLDHELYKLLIALLRQAAATPLRANKDAAQDTGTEPRI